MRTHTIHLFAFAFIASCASSSGGVSSAPDVAVRCVLPSDCGRGFYCSPAGACTNDCREDRDCVGSAAGPVCAVAEGRCTAADASSPKDAAPEASLPDVSSDLPPPPMDAAPDAAEDVLPDLPVDDGPAPLDSSAPDLPAIEEDAAVDVAAPDVEPADALPALDAAPDASADRPLPDAAPDAPACVSPPLPVTSGLWARYRFDGDASDDSGSRRDGTLRGPVRFASSPNCQAAEFTAGTGAFVDVPDVHFSAVTVAAWARPDASGSLFDGWTRSENVLLSAATVGGALQWEARFHDRPDTSREYNEIVTRSPARPGAWQHVAATYDGTTLRLFVDGELRGSSATDRTSAHPSPTGDPDLRVGIDRSGAGWTGAVDDLAVYERALSDREVALLAGCAGGVCATTCPAGQHRCDGACVSDSAVATCGTRCSPCPSLPSSTVSCDGSACRYEVTLQPGPGVAKDIWTTSVYSFAPGGSGPGGGRDDDTLKVGGWGDTYLSLLQFDLSGLPPSPTGATLELYCYGNNGATNTAVWVDRITAPWDWRTSGTGRDRERLWWSDRPPATPWMMVGAPAVGAWQRIDVLPLVSDWVSGRAPNHGLQLRPVGTSNNFNFYYSGDFTDDPSRRPRLLVRY